MNKNPPSGQNLSGFASKHLSDTVLFYTDVPRIFRTTSIGYLYEIARAFPVILLSENLDRESEGALKQKAFFPRLKEIIPVGQYGTKGLWLDYTRLHNLAKETVERYAPRMVIATGAYPFENYLRRYAKRKGAITISAIGPIYGETKKRNAYHVLNATYVRTPAFFPSFAREAIILARKYSAHLLYYWILPLSIGKAPFIKQPSFPLMGRYERYKGGADYYVVNLKMDYEALTDEGVPREKLLLIAHPLAGPSRGLFEKVFFAPARKWDGGGEKKKATIIWPYDKVGFRDDTHTLVPEGVIEETNKKIVLLTSRILHDWKIIIKAHPARPDASRIKYIFKKYANIEVVSPLDPIDEYIETSDAIIGPSPVSTALYTASLQCPQKPIISLDLHKLLLGDSFKHIRGIDYIDNETKFVAALTSIRDNAYQKKKNNSEEKTFPGIMDAIRFIQKKHTAKL